MIDDVSRVTLLSSIIPVIIDIHIIPYNLGYKICNNDMVVMGDEGEGAKRFPVTIDYKWKFKTVYFSKLAFA